MASNVSVQSDGKLNDTLSGTKQLVKLKEFGKEGLRKVIVNYKNQAINLDNTLKFLADRIKIDKNEVIIFVDQQGEEIEFDNDQEFGRFIEVPTIFQYRIIPVEMSKHLRNLSSTQEEGLKPEMKENNILGKQIIQDNYLSPRVEKREEKVMFEPIKEENEYETKAMDSESTNYQGIIESILKEPSNLRKIAQRIQGLPNSSSKPTPFNLSCSFCKKSQLSNKIMACQMNLSIISCQECSPYLQYRLPFPFKVFTNPTLYQTELSSQSPISSSTFNDILKQERLIRNRTLKDKLSRLSLQA